MALRHAFGFLAAAVLLAALSACTTETRPVTNEMKAQARDQISRAQMPEHEGWDFQETDGGVRYIELAPGTGDTAWFGDTVGVHYTLWLTDGTLVEENRPEGIGFEFSFEVGQGRVISGWEEVIRSMNVGSEVLAVVPWKEGYGRNGRGNIPGRADLVFAVKLMWISN